MVAKLVRPLRGERGYSLVWTAGVIALIAVPLLALTVGVGRWFLCQGELQKAADMAALAAAQEVDVARFRDTGEVVLLPSAYEVAHRYAWLNAGYLSRRGLRIYVQAVRINRAERTVEVVLRADISSLFPRELPDIVIEARGTAQVRGLHR